MNLHLVQCNVNDNCKHTQIKKKTKNKSDFTFEILSLLLLLSLQIIIIALWPDSSQLITLKDKKRFVFSCWCRVNCLIDLYLSKTKNPLCDLLNLPIITWNFRAIDFLAIINYYLASKIESIGSYIPLKSKWTEFMCGLLFVFSLGNRIPVLIFWISDFWLNQSDKKKIADLGAFYTWISVENARTNLKFRMWHKSDILTFNDALMWTAVTKSAYKTFLIIFCLCNNIGCEKRWGKNEECILF